MSGGCLIPGRNHVVVDAVGKWRTWSDATAKSEDFSTAQAHLLVCLLKDPRPSYRSSLALSDLAVPLENNVIPLEDHHHFKSELIPISDTVASYERYVVDLLLNSTLPDSQRENSIAWELKHHAGVVQMARILARKRGLPIDVCSVGMLLHDIYAIVHGKYKDHAHLGVPLAKEVIDQIGGFTAEDVLHILDMVYHHSDKHIWSGDPFQEFGKDADILDCFLYPNVFGYYLRHKRLDVFSQYLVRAKLVWRELEMPDEVSFDLLRGYSTKWFDLEARFNWQLTKDLLVLLLYFTSVDKGEGLCPPAFCLRHIGTEYVIYSNGANWNEYLERLRGLRAHASKHFATLAPSGGDPWSTMGFPLAEYLDFANTQIWHSFNANSALANPIYELETEATTILTELGSGESLLMIWPAIDAYELLKGEQLRARVHDLGLLTF